MYLSGIEIRVRTRCIFTPRSSNCTLVELKSNKELYNFNRKYSSNCTLVELKCDLGSLSERYFGVLIVP